MRRTIALALLASLTACETPTWDKPGATTQDFDRESYPCERDARAAGDAVFVYGSMVRVPNRALFEKCMRGQGWTKTKG